MKIISKPTHYYGQAFSMKDVGIFKAFVWHSKKFWLKSSSLSKLIYSEGWPFGSVRRGLYCSMRRCQIKVQFECRAKTKFLAALFQPITSISDYQSVPWSHSFQKMYNTHMCKRHLIVEKWGFSKKIYLNFIKNCKVLLECFTLGHFINTFMKTNYKVSYMNGFVLA